MILKQTYIPKSLYIAFLFCFFGALSLQAQNVVVEGYVFEQGNRGYLNLAKITIIDVESGMQKGLAMTDQDGKFISEVPVGRNYEVMVQKDLFEQKSMPFSTVDKAPGEKVFLKCQLIRQPGYLFDVTIAERRAHDSIPVDAIEGATIEVYNNTKKQEVLTLRNHPTPTFKCHFNDGNHYTVLIRKKGYFNKRMEAFVNVKGCILCFEGVGNVKPSDVLTEGNSMGTLLANVDLERIVLNEGVKLNNIYYDYAKSSLKQESKEALDKLINVLKNNPTLVVELGAHTDSRGDDDYNYKLSQERAQAAVDYILVNSSIEKHRIQAVGYGENELVNKCSNANASSCSEEEHALNRRTELKVVGRLSEESFGERTLTDILEAEQFDQMLKELENQEVVRIEAGEEVPEEFLNKDKKVAEKTVQAAPPQIEQEGFGMNAPPIAQVPVKEELKVESLEVESSISETMIEEDEVVLEIEKEEETFEEVKEAVVVEEIIKEEIVKESGEKIETVVETKVEMPAEPITGKIVEATPMEVRPSVRPESETLVTESTMGSGPSTGNKIFEAMPVSTPRPAPKPLDMPNNYTGYRIEFFTSPQQLPGSHKIFYRHGQITIDQKNDGTFSYLLGSFQEEKDAEDFLENILKPQYSNAQVVRYRKGSR